MSAIPEIQDASERELAGWDAMRIEPATSPSRLAARAVMVGFPTKGLNGSNYLDFGFGTGANLVAHAVAFPEVSFTCVAAEESSNVRAFALQAKALNVETRDIDLASFAADIDMFDFIVANDTFARATTAERMALFVLTKKHLAQEGVACIGIDVHPDGRERDSLRDLLGLDDELTNNPGNRIQALRRRIASVLRDMSTGQHTDHRHLMPEIKRLSGISDAELHRDLLDPARRACTMDEFFSMASAAKLQIVGDVDPLKTNPIMLPENLRREVGATGEGDLLSLCQHIDRHTHVRRRHVLLCHVERQPEAMSPVALLDSVLIASCLTRSDLRQSDADLLKMETVIFEGPIKYQTANVTEIVTLALLERNAHFPVSVPRLALHVIAAMKKAGVENLPTDRITAYVAKLCLKLLPTGALSTHMAEARSVRSPGRTPVLSPLALHQVRLGQDYVASLTPHRVRVDPAARFILSRLDGTQTGPQIIEELEKAVSEGQFTIASTAPTPEARARETYARVVGHAATSGLLIG